MRFWKKYYLTYVFLLAVFVGGAMLIEKSAHRVLPANAESAAPCRTVVIDPGHGGEDGGAVSALGTRESNLNLQISLRIRDLFRLLGIPAVMTHSTDISIYDSTAQTVSEKKVSDLKNRVSITNSTPNALLLSIHQNMFSDGKYSGAQVFFAQTEGSEALAERLQDLLRDNADPSNHREAKPSSAVWLMEHIDCTGVLVECGFLSNAAEEQRLKTDDYQKKLSCIIVCGTAEFLSEEK